MSSSSATTPCIPKGKHGCHVVGRVPSPQRQTTVRSLQKHPKEVVKCEDVAPLRKRVMTPHDLTHECFVLQQHDGAVHSVTLAKALWGIYPQGAIRKGPTMYLQGRRGPTRWRLV
jgi:hypothetical protein